MEEDIDIYADLPSIDLKSDKNDPIPCKCNELKKELSELTSKLKNIQTINENLERNLSSLLKTAKAEIARKDRMLDDLRKQLDDIAFRRNMGRSSSYLDHGSSHQQYVVAEEHESVASSRYSEEKEFLSHRIESPDDEYKSRKPQNDVGEYIPVTLFGERLHKKIMNEEKEEKKQRTLSKLSAEAKDVKEISEECVVESDKENGSHTGINNNANESNAIIRSSSSEIPYKRNSEKRPNEDDTCKSSKRLKTDDNKNETDDADCNYVTQYEMKDNPVKFEDRLSAEQQSFEKKQILFGSKRAASEDTKQGRSTSTWKKDQKSNSVKDYDESRTRKGSADSLRSFRVASTSNEGLNGNYHRDRHVNGHRKNYRRCDSPNFKSGSRSRSDYESSNSHRLREKSRRMYRDRKYDDCKYDGRYKNDKLRKDYDSKENDSDKARYSNRKRDDLWDKFRHSSSDIEDRENRSSSYKSNRYNSRRIKETVRNVSDRRSHESDKAASEINFRASSSRAIVNTMEDNSAKKNTEQHKQTVKNKLHDIRANLAESTERDTSNLEDGEILDSNSSPEKKNDSTKISRDRVTKENVVKTISVEDKDENASANASRLTSLKVDTINTKWLEETTDISTRKIEAALPQVNSKDEVTRLSFAAENIAAIDEKCNSESRSNENLTKISTTQNITVIEPAHKNHTDDSNHENHSDENVKDSVSKNIAKIDEVNNFKNESAAKNEEANNINAECAKVEEAINSNADGNAHKTDTEQSKDLSHEVGTVPNCNIQDNADKSYIPPVKSETSRPISDESNAKVSRSYLSDHNYVRNTPTDVSKFDVIRKTPAESTECHKAVSEAATSKKSKEKEAEIVKKTTLTMKSKKEQQSKTVISRRRRAVMLSDSNASMTVLMNTNNTAKAVAVVNNSVDNNDSALKPRACKLVRVCKSSL